MNNVREYWFGVYIYTPTRILASYVCVYCVPVCICVATEIGLFDESINIYIYHKAVKSNRYKHDSLLNTIHVTTFLKVRIEIILIQVIKINGECIITITYRLLYIYIM